MKSPNVIAEGFDQQTTNRVEALLGESFSNNNCSDKNSPIDEAVLAEIIGSRNLRYGTCPAPENKEAISKAIAFWVEKNEPIPILCPWGSKKATSTKSIDVAEIFALHMLKNLSERVSDVYSPGIKVNLLVEDLGGYFLFEDEGETGRKASEKYVADFLRLLKILGYESFINPIKESDFVTEGEHKRLVGGFCKLLTRYIVETDEKGLKNFESLKSWKELEETGWKGMIPYEQRDHYRDRYKTIYEGMDHLGATKMLARYLAQSLAKYKSGASGVNEEWKGNFVQVSFVKPVPGVPETSATKRVYYRTLPMKYGETHIPPWRGRGYLKISDEKICPKMENWSKELPYQTGRINLSRGDLHVAVDANYVVVGPQSIDQAANQKAHILKEPIKI